MRCPRFLWLLKASSVLSPLMLVALISGCALERQYIISETPPFVLYSNKDAALTRSAWLVAYRGSGDDFEPLPLGDKSTGYTLQYSKHDGDNPNASSLDTEQYRANKYMAFIELPVGTRVHVCETYFESSQQSIFQGFFHLEDVATCVEVELNVPGWPHRVRAGFDFGEPQLKMRIQDGKGKIRPAPWEPLGTPADRYITWPSDRYLVKGDKGK